MSQLKIIKAIHVTQTEKNHIKQLLALNVKEGHTKIKHYKVLSKRGDRYKILINTTYLNDYGARRIDRQTIVVDYS